MQLQKNACGIVSTNARNHIGPKWATLYAKPPKGFGKFYGNKKETTSQSNNESIDNEKPKQNDEKKGNVMHFFIFTESGF